MSNKPVIGLYYVILIIKFCNIVTVDIFNLKKGQNIVLHLVFWIAVWLFYRYFFSYNSEVQSYVNWFSALLVPLTMLVTYIMTYVLIPKYLLTKRYGRFAIYTFYLIVLSCYITTLIIYGTLFFFLDFNVLLMPPMSRNFLFIIILVLLVVGVVSSVAILGQNLKNISRNKELQNKILATQLELKEQELNYLKSQIHPHFLFNTLNTIYGMALKQSEQTPDIILRLSNLLDYILYQVNKPRVSLKEEVLHIEEYMELEKVRFKDTLKAKLVKSNISEEIEIAPMLLIPFVENAFKHGNIIEGYLNIDINVHVEGDELQFRIRNSTKTEGANANGGIGLENITKRLDLHYADNYDLSRKLINNNYEVYLKINTLSKIKNAGKDTMHNS